MMGGLGNILFSLSTAYALSKKYNLDLKLCYNHTGYLHTPPSIYKNNIFNSFKELGEKTNFQLINQIKFDFYEIEIPKNTNVFLNGYFQSENNFLNFKSDLITKLSPQEKNKKILLDKYPDLKLDRTVSVHVRKGNYKNLQEFHPLLSKEYYFKALENFIDHKIFIFSDDIESCYDIFKRYDCAFIKNDFDLDDLYCMSLCKNNIIANSTFSWWGAWLNQNLNKKVIAPSTWFGSKMTFTSKDMIPKEWTII
jgi:hypothetical protein